MDQSPPRRIYRLCRVVGLLAPLVFAAAMFSFVRDRSAAGIDFAVFHLGGRLVKKEGFSSVYDRDVFREELAPMVPSADVAGSLTYFISPPPWAWIFQPVSAVDFSQALLLWTAVGLLALFAAVKGLELPLVSVAIIAASPAFIMNVAIGQSGFYYLLLAVLVHRSCAADSKIAAGLLLGLFILKPPLAVGWVLWWLLDIRRWYPALMAASGSALLVALPTLTNNAAPWRLFLEVLRLRVEDEGRLRVNSPSFAEFVKLLFPGGSLMVTAIGWLLAAIIGAAVVQFARKRFDDTELCSGAAVFATLLSSPHLSIYDTGLVLIPIAVLVKRGVLDVNRFSVVWALYVGGIVFGPVWFEMQLQVFGRGVGLEFPAMAAITVLACRWLEVDYSRYWRMREPSMVSAST